MSYLTLNSWGYFWGYFKILILKYRLFMRVARDYVNPTLQPGVMMHYPGLFCG